MAMHILRFVNTFIAAVVMGTVFGIWAGFSSYDLSAEVYIVQQQNMIRNLNVVMPVLGFITILLTLLGAFFNRRDKPVMFLLISAAFFFIAAGIITRFGNQVLNAQMMRWDPLRPPANWAACRERWWMLHFCRTLTTLAGTLVLIWVNTSANKRNNDGETSRAGK